MLLQLRSDLEVGPVGSSSLHTCALDLSRKRIFLDPPSPGCRKVQCKPAGFAAAKVASPTRYCAYVGDIRELTQRRSLGVRVSGSGNSQSAPGFWNSALWVSVYIARKTVLHQPTLHPPRIQDGWTEPSQSEKKNEVWPVA